MHRKSLSCANFPSPHLRFSACFIQSPTPQIFHWDGARLSVRIAFIRISSDPVRSHGRSNHTIPGLGDDGLSLLKRHVAVDAVCLGRGPEFHRRFAAFNLVATKAFL